MKYAFPLLLFALTGCLFGGDPNIEGVWSGSNAVVTFSMTVVENNKTVTGTGTITGSTGGFLALTVTGTHVHPSVALTLSSPGFLPFSFNGSFETDDLITGLLNGSGFNNEQISLLRSRS